MKSISEYLEKFKKIISSKDDLYNEIIKVIKEVINIEIQNNKIKIKESILYINEIGIIKNEIFINKERIILEINKNQKSIIITDIR
ncbi:MAG: hypothetical protein US50_C0003G0004 [Candidatus Nomurabacteria bacterium GW2011_GWB1_37_5]|uniref:Uncharacterized protein n=1 Tax=Candidatus Nomurabacteria bacterium GW2011_GWB1_37_5 TaxID=1618742 RepID=A0A0G0JGI5_9BACT|nr:MAG: hypothetical protein US50_C0003G0004 [Candidatus Nomurabacteria bacterium GW2011_GWB1_37_5]